MTASLTPALALDYLHELSTDIRAGVVLDASGAHLAGEARLAARALELLASAADAGVQVAREEDGALLAVRGSNGAAIAVAAGRHALIPLLAHDLATVAQALGDVPVSRH